MGKIISLGFFVVLTISLLLSGTVTVMAHGTVVGVSAPGEATSPFFDVAIDVEGVSALDSGQFDLRFDANILEVADVKGGSIDDIAIPTVQWTSVDADTIRVLFNIPGLNGAGGSGTLALISFRVTGDAGGTSVLDISRGILVDTEANEVPATWLDGSVTIELAADQTYQSKENVPTSSELAQTAESDGVTISSSLAIGILVALTAIPILYIVIMRVRRR